MSAKAWTLKGAVGWAALTVLIGGVALAIWHVAFFVPPELSIHENEDGPIWFPRTRTIPSNQLKFYLLSRRALTQGDMFRHLELIDDTTKQTIEGAFREVELWSPDSQRFTLWLHPGRQKTGVNLNEDEGPVLIESHHYRLILKKDATTTDGKPIPNDVTLSFAVGPANHTLPDAQRFKILAPRAGTTDPLIVRFDEPMDTAMLRSSITVQADMIADDVTVNDDGTEWHFVPWRKWLPGTFAIEIDPNLEDLAGNNLLRPFETDATSPSVVRSAKPIKLTFTVK